MDSPKGGPFWSPGRFFLQFLAGIRRTEAALSDSARRRQRLSEHDFVLRQSDNRRTGRGTHHGGTAFVLPALRAVVHVERRLRYVDLSEETGAVACCPWLTISSDDAVLSRFLGRHPRGPNRRPDRDVRQPAPAAASDRRQPPQSVFPAEVPQRQKHAARNPRQNLPRGNFVFPLTVLRFNDPLLVLFRGDVF